ncbi:MAG: YbjQ family protein [bacterium]|nr:YbjQ family protein [bacterium]
MEKIPVTTGNEIPERDIVEILGVVRGSTVRTRNFVRDIGASLRTIVGGEVKTYTKMTQQARDEAYNRMFNEAIELHADAVIGVRFATSMVMDGAAEMLAYGTAVKLR